MEESFGSLALSFEPYIGIEVFEQHLMHLEVILLIIYEESGKIFEGSPVTIYLFILDGH